MAAKTTDPSAVERLNATGSYRRDRIATGNRRIRGSCANKARALPADSIPLGVMRLDLVNGRLTVSHVAGIVHLASSQFRIAYRAERQAGGVSSSQGFGSGAGTRRAEHQDHA